MGLRAKTSGWFGYVAFVLGAAALGAVASAASLAAVRAQQVTSTTGPSQGAVTPQEIARRLETRAAEIQKMAPSGADRFVLFDVAWPETAAEYRAIGKHAILFVAAVSQKAEELPLRRVYARRNGGIVELEKLSGQRSEVPAGSLARSVFGPYRADGFYLVPAGAILPNNPLFCDFAKNRNEFVITKAELTPPDFILADRDRNSISPQPDALKRFLEREFPGFAQGR